jgi:hypothetical protein
MVHSAKIEKYLAARNTNISTVLKVYTKYVFIQFCRHICLHTARAVSSSGYNYRGEAVVAYSNGTAFDSSIGGVQKSKIG